MELFIGEANAWLQHLRELMLRTKRETNRKTGLLRMLFGKKTCLEGLLLEMLVGTLGGVLR